MAEDAGNEDELGDLKVALDAAKCQKRWVQEIKYYETKSNSWEEKGKKILRRYKDARSPREQRSPRFNILWSNVQTLAPALYSRTPKPDIERRFRDKDDLGRISSSVLERSISYFINEEFDSAIKQAVIDRLLPGRGTVWVRYEPHFKDKEDDGNKEIADKGVEITDNAESYEPDEQPDEIQNEVTCFDYVHWQDFGYTFGRTWNEVDAVWRKVYLTREELVERFGEEIGEKIVLDYSPHDLKDNKSEEIVKKATIYEIWCKTDKMAYWIHKDYLLGPLDEQDDPLKLSDFFPTPKPLFATLANDDCIPVPDYQEYQDQANELDDLTSRIGAITKAVKVVGVYDASASGIERLLAEGTENQLIPVEGFAAMSEKGGISGAYSLMPMEEILQTLLGLYEARDKVKQDLYEITGIADIIRGATDANETATAQQIKSQFGTLRLSAIQDDVQRFVRDLIKIGTQIIAEHFSIETIKKISGVELLTNAEKQAVQQRQQIMQRYQQQQQGQQNPQMGHNGGPPMPPPQLPPLPAFMQKMDQEDMEEAMQNPTWEEVEELLRNEVTLSYKIDIETDSTIKFDQDAERDARVEFLQAAGGFLESATKVENPDLGPLMAKMLMFGIRGFKVGKELESAFEVAIHKLEKDAANPQQKPDPAMAKVQGELQIQQAQFQADQAMEKLRMQAEEQKVTLEDKRARDQAQVEGQNDLAKAKMDNETKIIVAKIGAGAKAVADGGSDTQIPADGATQEKMGPSLDQLLATVTQQLQQTFVAIHQSNQNVMQSHQALAQAVGKPKQVVRDPATQRIVGIQ